MARCRDDKYCGFRFQNKRVEVDTLTSYRYRTSHFISTLQMFGVL
jgi:hypothetical protein